LALQKHYFNLTKKEGKKKNSTPPSQQ